MRGLRLAVRAFTREPAFAAGIVLTFALVIGTNATMFGLVQRLMLAPPPGIRDADAVVRLGMTYATDDGSTFTMTTTSYPVFRAVASLAGPFDRVAAERTDSAAVGQGAELTQVPIVAASGEYFATLGVGAEVGRLFGPADDALPVGSDVVVLGHAYWQRTFAGDRGAIGRRMLVGGQQLTIIGVAPAGFNGTGLGAIDLFVPLSTAQRSAGPGWASSTGVRMLTVVARLRPGVTADQAARQVRASILEATGERPGQLTATPLVSVVPGRGARDSAQARVALWLTGVSLVVALIAAANVGTLLLLRATRRRRETAVRLALGASRGMLVRQSLLEGLLLALAGGLAGMLVARWLAAALRVLFLPGVAADTGLIDPTVLVASFAVASVAGLVAGAVPASGVTARALAADLRDGGGHGASGRFAAQHALLAVQVALSTVLLVGAGLFVRSLQRIQSQDLGFSTARLLYVSLDFLGPLPGVERDRASEEAVLRIATLPGVTEATVVAGMPFGSHSIPPIAIPGLSEPPTTGGQIPILYGATPAYLAMMGVVLREGRLFTAGDDARAPLVVLVNETMARTVWPGTSAIGQCVKAGFGADISMMDPMLSVALTPCRQVVGVVRDSRARSLRTEGSEAKLMQYYIPFPQLPTPPFPNVPQVHGILVRTAGDPARMVAPVQRIVQATSAVPVYARVRPYQQFLDPQLRSWRLGATVFSAFGALALAIAAVGLFAVVSYLVTQRTREIGVRMALGGSAAGVAGLVVRDAMRMASIGGAVGLVAALAAAPVVQGQLFETSAREPAILLLAVLTLLAITLLTAAAPAWRASRVSPLVALRADG